MKHIAHIVDGLVTVERNGTSVAMIGLAALMTNTRVAITTERGGTGDFTDVLSTERVYWDDLDDDTRREVINEHVTAWASALGCPVTNIEHHD